MKSMDYNFCEGFYWVVVFGLLLFGAQYQVINCNVVQNIWNRTYVKITSTQKYRGGEHVRKKKKKFRKTREKTKKNSEYVKTRTAICSKADSKSVTIVQNKEKHLKDLCAKKYSDVVASKSNPLIVKNLTQRDDYARSHKILHTEEATKPSTFTVQPCGGYVETPYCKIIFFFHSVSRPITITVTPKYNQKKKEAGSQNIMMTPELFFTSKQDMKFERPVELQMKTHFCATNKNKPIQVQIERTEHCERPNWLKIEDVTFTNGMIKFICNQFCGIRAVCRSCERHIMSMRVNYSISVNQSYDPHPLERSFLLRVYTDSPETHEQVIKEMQEDNHRRVHPTQKYTIRNGYNLMVHLKSSNMECRPSFEVIEIDPMDEIILEARTFAMKYTDSRQIIATDRLPIDACIAEICPFKKFRMDYNCGAPTNPTNNLNITVHGGIGIQNNITEGVLSNDAVQGGRHSTMVQSGDVRQTSSFQGHMETRPKVIGASSPSVTESLSHEPTIVPDSGPISDSSPSLPENNVSVDPLPSVGAPSKFAPSESPITCTVNHSEPYFSPVVLESESSASHPSYHQSLPRSGGQLQKSAFFTPLRKIQSTPSFADLLKAAPTSSSLEPNRPDALEELSLEDQYMLYPKSNNDYSDEVAAVMDNFVQTSTPNHASVSVSESSASERIPSSNPSRRIMGSGLHMSAIRRISRENGGEVSGHSDIESGFGTRGTSACTNDAGSPVSNILVQAQALLLSKNMKNSEKKEQATQTENDSPLRTYSDAVRTRKVSRRQSIVPRQRTPKPNPGKGGRGRGRKPWKP